MAANDDEAKTVTIKIKVLGSEVLHELTVPLSTSILTLKEKVSEFCKFPVESIRLIFRGRSLQNDEKLSTYNVEDGHTIIVHCSRNGQKNNNSEDPPPPPRNLNPPPPSASQDNNQGEPNMFPQTPSLPPLPHNTVTDFKRELSVIQHNIAILLNSASNLQMNLTRTNVNEINESIEKYTIDSRQILRNTYIKLQSIQNTHFVTNNSRVEVDEENNTNNNNNPNNNNPNVNNTSNTERNNNANMNPNHPSTNTSQNAQQQQQQQQQRPVIDDIFTPNDKAFIQSQVANLDEYVEDNKLDDSYSSTDIYKQLN